MRIEALQNLMAALSDPVRLRILYLLFAHQDVDCDVSSLVETLRLPQPTVSRHLARLREEGLVAVRVDGKRRLYALADYQPEAHRVLLAAMEGLVAATPEVQEDLRIAAGTLGGSESRKQVHENDLTSGDSYATKWLRVGEDEDGEQADHTDEVFRALSNRTRRILVDRIQASSGATLAAVGEDLGSSRQAVRKHVNVLADAGLVHVVKDGRRRRLYYNAVPLQELYDRWTDERSALMSESMLAVKRTIETRDRDG